MKKAVAAAIARVALLLALTACAGARQPETVSFAVTTLRLITQQAAIEAALRIAMSSYPEMSASLVLPRDIVATQMTLTQAEQIVRGQTATVPAGYSSNLPVWVVTMEGWWLDEFPRPTDSPIPEPHHHLVVILDAAAGLEVEALHQP